VKRCLIGASESRGPGGVTLQLGERPARLRSALRAPLRAGSRGARRMFGVAGATLGARRNRASRLLSRQSGGGLGGGGEGRDLGGGFMRRACGSELSVPLAVPDGRHRSTEFLERRARVVPLRERGRTPLPSCPRSRQHESPPACPSKKNYCGVCHEGTRFGIG
jgi:hypothetical protein